MLIRNLVAVNYATVLIVLFMIIFLLCNASFERKTVRMFMISILTALILVVVDSVESYTETLDHPTMLRVWMSAIGYTVRPISILCVLLIITDKSYEKRIMLSLPSIINTIIVFSALFSDVAFSYSENNEFVRGPLGYSTYVAGAIYLFLLCVTSVRYIQQKNYYEALIVFGIAFINVLSIYLEAVYKFEGFINVSIAISVTFYYLYYHTQSFKMDVLTKALNRRTYEVDLERENKDITAIISLDLNFLKTLNDTQGHLAGDKALVAVAKCVKDNLISGCRFYRVGGDEFEIIYFRDTVKKLDKMIENIRRDVEKSVYSCAIGLAIVKEGESLQELVARADALMYEDKLRIKEKNRK